MTILSTDSQPSAAAERIWTKTEAEEWFETGEWLNGLKLKPHQSIDRLEFAKQYHRRSAFWDKAFAYLNNTDLDNLAPGKYPIDGENVFAIVAEAEKKDFAATKWESHREYQDIQLVIQGQEQMGIAPLSALRVTEPYDEKKDVIFYSGDADYHLAEPGIFFIFFPADGHRPDIKVKGFNKNKKIVIKVKT